MYNSENVWCNSNRNIIGVVLRCTTLKERACFFFFPSLLMHSLNLFLICRRRSFPFSISAFHSLYCSNKLNTKCLSCLRNVSLYLTPFISPPNPQKHSSRIFFSLFPRLISIAVVIYTTTHEEEEKKVD